MAPEQGTAASTTATERSEATRIWCAMVSPMIPAPTTMTSCSDFGSEAAADRGGEALKRERDRHRSKGKREAAKVEMRRTEDEV